MYDLSGRNTISCIWKIYENTGADRAANNASSPLRIVSTNSKCGKINLEILHDCWVDTLRLGWIELDEVVKHLVI